MGRFGVYAAVSIAVAGGIVSYAWQTRVQFYPTVIYLVTSKFAILALCNLALVATVLFGKLTKRLFLGTLRDAETELLYENSRYAITETCLALTIFREELSLRVVALFTALLFSKIFHWLCQSRCEYIESAQVVRRSTHFRVLSLMGFLFVVDAAFVAAAVYVTLKSGPSVMLLFGFEYIILALTTVSIFTRYMLHLIDTLYVQGPWFNKNVYQFYLDLGSDVVRLFVYLLFFLMLFTYYGLPLHIVRDLYMAFSKLRSRFRQFLLYRRISANMNERFPDASAEDLERHPNCIICREAMDNSAKTLPCGHVYHFYCLRSWLVQQQSCPYCRSPVPDPAGPNAAAGAAEARAAAEAAAAAAPAAAGDAAPAGAAAPAAAAPAAPAAPAAAAAAAPAAVAGGAAVAVGGVPNDPADLAAIVDQAMAQLLGPQQQQLPAAAAAAQPSPTAAATAPMPQQPQPQQQPQQQPQAGTPSQATATAAAAQAAQLQAQAAMMQQMAMMMQQPLMAMAGAAMGGMAGNPMAAAMPQQQQFPMQFPMQQQQFPMGGGGGGMPMAGMAGGFGFMNPMAMWQQMQQQQQQAAAAMMAAAGAQQQQQQTQPQQQQPQAAQPSAVPASVAPASAAEAPAATPTAAAAATEAAEMEALRQEIEQLTSQLTSLDVGSAASTPTPAPVAATPTAAVPVVNVPTTPSTAPAPAPALEAVAPQSPPSALPAIQLPSASPDSSQTLASSPVVPPVPVPTGVSSSTAVPAAPTVAAPVVATSATAATPAPLASTSEPLSQLQQVADPEEQPLPPAGASPGTESAATLRRRRLQYYNSGDSSPGGQK